MLTAEYRQICRVEVKVLFVSVISVGKRERQSFLYDRTETGNQFLKWILRIIQGLFTSHRADDGDCAWTVDSQCECSVSALRPGVVDTQFINSALKTEVVKLVFFLTY